MTTLLILADFDKTILNSCFDKLPMHLSQFDFVSLKEHVRDYHLHVLELHIAYGKIIRKNVSQCPSSGHLMTFYDLFQLFTHEELAGKNWYHRCCIEFTQWPLTGPVTKPLKPPRVDRLVAELIISVNL